MPTVRCRRDSASQEAVPIQDIYLTTVDACVARGRVELDLNSGAIPFTVEIPGTLSIRPGSHVFSDDRITGKSWHGVVAKIQRGVQSTPTGIFQVTILTGWRAV